MSVTDQQLAEFKEAFAFYDTDSDGFIATDDLATVMRSLGQFPSKAALQNITSTLPSGAKLDFDAFLKIMQEQMQEQDTLESIMEAFRVFDKDATGTVNAGELRHIMFNLGEQMDRRELDKMIEDAKPDKMGLIHYEEFMKRLLSA